MAVVTMVRVDLRVWRFLMRRRSEVRADLSLGN
jgi:hypothetical protein